MQGFGQAGAPVCCHVTCCRRAAQVRVATSQDLKEQVGSKVFFDLVDFEQARPGLPPVLWYSLFPQVVFHASSATTANSLL